VIYLTPLYFEGELQNVFESLYAYVSPARAVNQTLFSDEHLSDEQRSAIQMALTHPVSVLTGSREQGRPPA
jgi:hypothetical protein